MVLVDMDKKFIDEFEKKVKNNIRKYKLLSKKDKILVACSGGKDSTTVLYLLNKFGYDVEAIIIDLLIGKWSEENLKNLKKFCKDYKIKLNIVNIRKEYNYSICYIRSGIQSKKKLSNCMICGVIKRWLLNTKAREFKAKKIVTGHNLDDCAETVIMNMFRGNQKLGLGLGPKSGILNDKKFVPRIKPLYFCTNQEIRKYSELKGFPVLYDPCPCSEGVFRRDVRNFLNELEKTDSQIKENIVENFIKLLPVLKENFKFDEILKYCKICNEPSRNDTCKRCELMQIMKE